MKKILNFICLWWYNSGQFKFCGIKSVNVYPYNMMLVLTWVEIPIMQIFNENRKILKIDTFFLTVFPVIQNSFI